jgi:hypothetical protein
MHVKQLLQEQHIYLYDVIVFTIRPVGVTETHNIHDIKCHD